METKILFLCGHEVNVSEFGEPLEVHPPDIENPYWEFKFKEVSILATEHTSVIIKNEKPDIKNGEKVTSILDKKSR